MRHGPDELNYELLVKAALPAAPGEKQDPDEGDPAQASAEDISVEELEPSPVGAVRRG